MGGARAANRGMAHPTDAYVPPSSASGFPRFRRSRLGLFEHSSSRESSPPPARGDEPFAYRENRSLLEGRDQA